MRRFGDLTKSLWILLLLLFSAESIAELAATTDRYQVALGDTFRLIITATAGEDLDDIELSGLRRDFEILGRSSRSEYSIVNGRRSHTRQLDVELAPNREGTLTIPTLAMGNARTRPIDITVTAEEQTNGINQPVTFEAEIDRSTAYVQGQIILTLRLIQAINLENRSISELELEGAFIKPLEQNTFQRDIRGRPALVNEIRYAIFPEQSGTLTIPAQTFAAREATQRRSLFDIGGNGRRLRRTTEPLEIEVLASPRQFPSNTWLPARNLTIEESWSSSPDQLEVGDSITRTITVRGEGLLGAQLPPVLFKPIDGLKFYPDQAVIGEEEAATGLIGIRKDSAALVPTRPGDITLPEIRIPWWDTEAEVVRYAVLPGRTLGIAAAASAATAPALQPLEPIEIAAPATTTSDSNAARPWQIVSAVSSRGWLLTVAYLVANRRRRDIPIRQGGDSGNSSERKAFKELQAACKENNALGVRQLLTKWVSSTRDGQDIRSPREAVALIGDSQLSGLVDDLEKSLYGTGAHAWQGQALAERLREIRSNISKKKVSAEELCLYPLSR
jgi:hypothetical protein